MSRISYVENYCMNMKHKQFVGVMSCTSLVYVNYLQGRFEILSLSGSFMPNDTGGTRSRSGGMSVSLASPDGRVVGGGVAGLLVAAGPVQVRFPPFFVFLNLNRTCKSLTFGCFKPGRSRQFPRREPTRTEPQETEIRTCISCHSDGSYSHF